jgi:DNA-binding protein HU-beta
MDKYGKTDLVGDVWKGTDGITRDQVATVVESTLATIQQRVANGNVVTIPGFGTWKKANRAARMGTNLRTKQKIQIPAGTTVRFSAGSTFKAAVSGKAATTPATTAQARTAGGPLIGRVKQKAKGRAAR